MIPEYESLLYRIKENPVEHIGRRSVTEINGYFIGYDLARTYWQQPAIHRRIGFETFRKWLDSKVHLCRQSIFCLCLLLAENESQAFDLFFELYDCALEEYKDDLIFFNQEQKLVNQNEISKSNTLIGFLFDAPIREKTGLYFGNNRWLSGLWAMCNGFIWAEKDMGIENSSDALNMELFQLWLDEHYPIAKGKTWDKLFYFLALHSESWALREFYEHFEMFLEGDLPDALSKTNREILKNVQAQIDKEKENK